MLKKISTLTAFALLLASAAFASGTAGLATGDAMTSASGGKSLYGDKTTAATTTALIGKSSTGAAVAVFSTALGYGLTTQHVNGTKAFGTSHDSTAIYSIDVTATKGTFKLGPGAIGTAQFSAWATM
ncbi:MAG TPA: hypothetical protein HPP94_11750 [Desulfuromonadales bacterium]|nr:hypothetical protein [Desulfuromonadales bacterium]